MPVIRSQPGSQGLPETKRALLLNSLVAELEGNAPPGGPVIFEMPIPQSDKIDVMVIWQDWQDIRPDDRAALIKDAYREKIDRLSLILGLTLQEAIDEGVLPYRVRMRFQQQPKFADEVLRDALLSAGASRGPEGDLVLRFPTPEIAEAARQRLSEKLPGGEWVVSYADV
jgi:hypothetical protein